MQCDIISIFPGAFGSYLKESLVKRALAKGILRIGILNPRDFASGRHHKVDGRPFGGGPGMVMQVEPIWKAVKRVISRSKVPSSKRRIILFSARGEKFDAKAAKRLSKYKHLIFICGRYEGVDERVAEHIADEEISIGDYVLSGGELAALVAIEAAARFLPGFLGKRESLEEIKGSHPSYTRPASFRPSPKAKPWNVPRVLLSGDHRKIEAWRRRK